MNILIIGGGGREHALAWKIKQSPLCTHLFVAPGNAGTDQIADNIPIDINDFEGISSFCKDTKIDLVVVGSEEPLVKGIRDYFESDPLAQHILMVGPGQSGARLEGSKDFAKNFMKRHKIPTAKAHVFRTHQREEALNYITYNATLPIVIKADGLAAGKGVIICTDRGEAKNVLLDMMEHNKFGEAGNKILIEEFMEGIELSMFILTDGKDYVILPEAKDYKRIGEHDKGPNTGGMGAISPVYFADDTFIKRVEYEIIRPTIEGLKKEHISYKGFLFMGLMNIHGAPYVIEYNVRMGDPETQAILPRIDTSLVDLLVATAKGQLAKTKPIGYTKNYTATVVMTSAGYPNEYKTGKQIESSTSLSHTLIFHAGTRREQNKLLTDGGRVLAVTGEGSTLDKALQNTYKIISHIQWDGSYFRKDIGVDLKMKSL